MGSRGFDLDELERLAAAATPGPWKLERGWDPPQGDERWNEHGRLPDHVDTDVGVVQEGVMGDIRFVEAMRVVAPELIMEIRILDREIRILDREIRRLQGDNLRMIMVINIMKGVADELDQMEPEVDVVPGITTTKELADYIRKIAGGEG